jgi:hypothetical protein
MNTINTSKTTPLAGSKPAAARGIKKQSTVKLCKLIALALAGLSVGPLAARATTIDLHFDYEDPNGLVTGNASLTATPVFGDPGAYEATAGTLNITAPSADQIAGSYSLFSNPGSPNAQYSPTGLFIYDDLIFPGSNPIVTNPGMLAFGGASLGNAPEGKGAEINFFSEGSNTYDLYTGVNGSYPYSYVFTTPQGGSATARVVVTPALAGARELVAAPEPATWLIMASFLLIGLLKAGSRQPVRE